MVGFKKMALFQIEQIAIDRLIFSMSTLLHGGNRLPSIPLTLAMGCLPLGLLTFINKANRLSFTDYIHFLPYISQTNLSIEFIVASAKISIDPNFPIAVCATPFFSRIESGRIFPLHAKEGVKSHPVKA
jgi:hypothetical protein